MKEGGCALPSTFDLYLNFMMPLRKFTIHQPKPSRKRRRCSPNSAKGPALRRRHRAAAGDEARSLALRAPGRCQNDSDLNNIEVKNSALVIGSTADPSSDRTLGARAAELAGVAAMAANVANIRVRASGTLGGNLCFAEPHSDPATLLTALGAKVSIQGKSAARTVAVEKLITGAYETSLAGDELLAGVEIPAPAKTQRAAYLKFQLKERPTLGLALVLDLDGDTIKKASAVVGSVSAVPTQSDKRTLCSPVLAHKLKDNSVTQPKRWPRPPIPSTISKAAPITSAT
jgi:hypothetical protein